MPEVVISSDSVSSTIITSNPMNANQLIASAADATCPNAGMLGVYSSVDGGLTWSSTCTQFISDGEPAVAYGQNTAYVAGAYSGFPGAVYMQASTDGGQTWSSRVLVTDGILPGVTNVASLQVDNSLSSPFMNSAYISATQFDVKVVESQISVSHSTDGGNSWITTPVEPVEYKPIVDQFSRLAIGSDGTVYVAWQRCAIIGPSINCADTDAQMLLSKSTDGGNTWSTPAVIATVHLAPDTCDCAFFGNLPLTNEAVSNMPVLGIDNSSGPHADNLYAVMYTWTGTQMRTLVATSADKGKTWGKPVVVAPTKHDQFFASLSVSPSGIVGVSWMDRRNDPLNVSYQPFAAGSLNGGASFTKSYPVTTILSDPYLDGNGGTYMGDYTGNTWAGNNYFLVTWPDSRNMQFMQDYVGGFRVH